MSRRAIIAPATIAPASPPTRRPCSMLLRSRSAFTASATASISSGSGPKTRSAAELDSAIGSTIRRRQSDDARLRVAPAAAAEQPLVQLAGRQAGQLGGEVG